MNKSLKKLVGLGCALLGSSLLVFSLVGVVGPGCGSGGDSCEAACNNYMTKCGSELDLSSTDDAKCVKSCRSANSMSAHEAASQKRVFDCVAAASTCDATFKCGAGL
jgi:hypothetical protein